MLGFVSILTDSLILIANQKIISGKESDLIFG